MAGKVNTKINPEIEGIIKQKCKLVSEFLIWNMHKTKLPKNKTSLSLHG